MSYAFADGRAASAGMVARLFRVARSVNFGRIYDLVYADDFRGLRALIRAGWDVNQQDKWTGSTALLLACEKRRVKLVKLLLHHGADPDLCHYDGWNCYDVARNGSIKRLLVAHGFSWQPAEWSEGAGRATIRWMSARTPVDLVRSLAFTGVDIWVEHQVHAFPRVHGAVEVGVAVEGVVRYECTLVGPGHERRPVVRAEQAVETTLNLTFRGFRGDVRVRTFCPETVAIGPTPHFALPNWDR
jgi:hypothetical protein